MGRSIGKKSNSSSYSLHNEDERYPKTINITVINSRLLFLNEVPSSGADLLERIEAEMSHCLSDSAGLYRSLQSLEKEGSIKANWKVLDSGPPRKIYSMIASWTL
jgi:hypothetical protein